MRLKLLLLILCVIGLSGCRSAGQSRQSLTPASSSSSNSAKAPGNTFPVIHVFVALCDNVNQGIVPVSAALGNGEDPPRNLYWGAAFGVKTFFGKNKNWQLVRSPGGKSSRGEILERVIFKRSDRQVFLVADAYRGSEIKRATQDFLEAAAGVPGETVNIPYAGKNVVLQLGGSAQLVAYVGHDGLMDFQLASFPRRRDEDKREAIILACASKNYFTEPLRLTGAKPLLWTTNLMAPEAYILSAAIDGWLNKESDEQIRTRAARAYDQYQHCGLKSANRLFATGW